MPLAQHIFEGNITHILSIRMISNEETFIIVKEFLKARLEIDTGDLTMQSKLEDLGIDSLMLMELIFDFEDKLSFQMPDLEDRPTTIGELVRVVQANLPGASSANAFDKTSE
jgi:acyl carrier protein